MMRRFVMCFATVLATSAAFAGDYGTIDLGSYTRGPVAGNGGQFNWVFDDTNVALPSGWSLDPSIDFSANPDRLASFCIEIGVSQNAGSGTFDLNDLTNSPINPTNGVMTAQQATDVGLLAENYFLSIVDNNDAGAFQLAVWEVIYGDYDAINTNISGTGISSGSIKSAAQVLLDSLPSQGGSISDVAGLRTLAMTNNSKQDQIIVVSVPELTSMLAWVFVTGAIGLVQSRRKK